MEQRNPPTDESKDTAAKTDVVEDVTVPATTKVDQLNSISEQLSVVATSTMVAPTETPVIVLDMVVPSQETMQTVAVESPVDVATAVCAAEAVSQSNVAPVNIHNEANTVQEASEVQQGNDDEDEDEGGISGFFSTIGRIVSRIMHLPFNSRRTIRRKTIRRSIPVSNGAAIGVQVSHGNAGHVQAGTTERIPNSTRDLFELTCSICFMELYTNKPTATICGHIFCERCINRALEMRKKCPKCNKRMQSRTLRRVYL